MKLTINLSHSVFSFFPLARKKNSVTIPSKLGNTNLGVLELASFLNDVYAYFLRKMVGRKIQNRIMFEK